MKPTASKKKVSMSDSARYPFLPQVEREMASCEELNPGFTEKNKYFYMATLKESEAVIDCFTARFTWSAKSEQEMADVHVRLTR
jgi:hypothetical protein